MPVSIYATTPLPHVEAGVRQDWIRLRFAAPERGPSNSNCPDRVADHERAAIGDIATAAILA